MTSPEKKEFFSFFLYFKEKNRSLITSVFILLFFAILIFWVYAGTLEFSFVFDDVLKIEQNPNIRLTQLSLKKLAEAGFRSSPSRPIAFMSFALNYYFDQYHPLGYHIVNIVIHILTGFFLYLFLKATLTLPSQRSRYSHPNVIAFLAALIWLVHPVQTQSVTYIMQRMNSMASMFFILAFWLYVKGRSAGEGREKWPWFAGSAGMWLVSLGCKQITVVFPFLVFLYEWYFFQDLDKTWFKRSLKYAGVIAGILIFISLAYTGFHPLEKFSRLTDYADREFTVAERALTQLRVVVHYISLLFFPHPSRLNIDYDFPLSHSFVHPITTLFSFIVIIGLIALAIYLAKRQRLISFGILWFFANLVIESSIIPLAIIFEHRLYLPSMLTGLVVVILADRYLKPKWVPVGLICTVIALCTYWTFERNKVWQNKLTLWTDCVKKSPNKARPHYNLGWAFADQNMTDAAIDQYRESLKLKPNFVEAHVNLGNALEEQGQADAAVKQYLAALQINPNSAAAHDNLGVVLAKQDRLDEAVEQHLAALKIDPDSAKILFNLGAALAAEGKTDQAVARFEQALKINPDYAEVHNNLGGLLEKLGKTDLAIYHFKEALRLDPNIVEAYNNLGISLMKEGKIDAAILQFREALRLNPVFAMAARNLNRALAIQKNFADQIAQIQAALKATPDDPVLHYRLGSLYLGKGELNAAVGQYEKAVSLRPQFAEARNYLALAYAEKKEYPKALDQLFKMLDDWPDNAQTYYNIACIYSQLNEIDKSVDWLKKAIRQGYDNWDMIETDRDLENIRETSDYQELIKDRG